MNPSFNPWLTSDQKVEIAKKAILAAAAATKEVYFQMKIDVEYDLRRRVHDELRISHHYFVQFYNPYGRGEYSLYVEKNRPPRVNTSQE